jgi:hypothetical protein
MRRGSGGRGVPFGYIGWRKIAPLLLLSKLEERFVGVRIRGRIQPVQYKNPLVFLKIHS